MIDRKEYRIRLVFAYIIKNKTCFIGIKTSYTLFYFFAYSILVQIMVAKELYLYKEAELYKKLTKYIIKIHTFHL